MQKTKFILIASIYAVLVLFAGCQKEITVDLPAVPQQIVVEGNIENGKPPLVLLTWSQGYFDPIDLSALADLFVRDANVRIVTGHDTVPLIQICSDDLTDEQLQQAGIALGTTAEALRNLHLCAYASSTLLGQENTVYKLIVDYQTHHVESTTKIDRLVQLDTLWFAVPGNNPDDSLGFINGFITDPDTAGNAYRWFAKRISHYPSWVPDTSYIGQQKDNSFIAPIGSVFDDEFFNGLHFQFAYYRGTSPNSTKFDDQNRERGSFKEGDTVVVRGCVIDRGAFSFFRTFENQLVNQGSPFSLPNNIISNVSGGLGVWVGYGCVYDTVVCRR